MLQTTCNLSHFYKRKYFFTNHCLSVLVFLKNKKVCKSQFLLKIKIELKKELHCVKITHMLNDVLFFIKNKE